MIEKTAKSLSLRVPGLVPNFFDVDAMLAKKARKAMVAEVEDIPSTTPRVDHGLAREVVVFRSEFDDLRAL